MALVRAIFRNKWYVPKDPDQLSFHGKTVVVTGSNVGLGAEAAYKFAAQHAARIILAVRDESKGARVQRILRHIAADPQCKVEVWKLDMLDYGSIKAFAKRCDEDLDQLDIAVLNAGVFMAEYKLSAYGWEQTLQVNTLSTTLLALMLLPKLRSSSRPDSVPVLEIVSSGRHYATKLSDEQKGEDGSHILDDFNAKDHFSGGLLYRASKLFLMYSMQTLASLATRESTAFDVLVVSVCPGACQSQLARGVDSMFMNFAKSCANTLFLRTSEEGSRTLVSGTSLGKTAHGQFWQNDIVRDPSDLLQGEIGARLRERVWMEIVDALEKDVPDIRAWIER